MDNNCLPSKDFIKGEIEIMNIFMKHEYVNSNIKKKIKNNLLIKEKQLKNFCIFPNS